MRMDDLRPAPGSRRQSRRLGRGHGSGRGTTAGRGTKGQKARTGGTVRPRFEGGQLPLSLRLPFKRGFHNRFRVEAQEVNLRALAGFPPNAEVDPEAMAAAQLIHSVSAPVKILGVGDVKHPLTVVADRFSASAKSKIEAAGGKAIQRGQTDETPEQQTAPEEA